MSHNLILKFPSLYMLFNRKNNGLKNALINIKGYNAIKKNNLFDTDYYLKNNGDVRLSGLDPILHYLYHGYKEGRDPNPDFDSEYYLKTHADVNLNPLVHYSLYGIKERRKINKDYQNPENKLEILENKLNIEKEKLKQAKNKIKELEEEKSKFSTVPDYKNHEKLTLKGKNGYLFLVNDSNHEIRQHFDQSYINNFNAPLFLKSLNSKKKYCYNNNIEHFFFIVPDKSLICKDFLPFDVKLVKRNYDLINNSVPDFIENLDPTCYFKNDSHINYLGGKELNFCYLNYIDNTFTRDDFNKLIEEQISIFNPEYNGDLTWEKNCSYSDEEIKDYLNDKITTFKNEGLLNLKENLPEEFKLVRTRETEHYKNPKGFKDIKVLVFRDSSLGFLKDILSVYFKELLLYWDHWFFNKELIEWYKPDIILEIRTERFLENMDYEIL